MPPDFSGHKSVQALLLLSLLVKHFPSFTQKLLQILLFKGFPRQCFDSSSFVAAFEILIFLLALYKSDSHMMFRYLDCMVIKIKVDTFFCPW